MKLNWFSPLPPTATDIGHFTMRVLPALSSLAEVTLWTETKFDPKLSQLFDVRTFGSGPTKWEELNRADACVYNIGNNPRFHGGIWQVARQHAGIVILHDTRLHHFFDGLYRVQQRDLSAYLEVMGFYYGAEGHRAGAECFASDARNINEMAEKYPLTELALENSLGAIVHTEGAFDALSADHSRPVVYLPLPFAARPPAQGEQFRPRASRTRGAGDQVFRLVMFGYIARNRRFESLLSALHGMHERNRFHLDVFGEILDNERELKAQIRELGLKRMVTLHGFAPEDALADALSHADLAINLRHPTMGEASGSQLRIWSHALPSLVTSVGWYATLPAEAVAHVRAGEHEVADIQSALHAFLAGPERFVEMGHAGRRILEAEHSPDQYARGLVDFIVGVKSRRARAAFYALAERTGELANHMFGQSLRTEALNGVAARIRGMDESA